ncbi:hypothetical protein CRYUN_Cryun02cG0053600 [Craigia yunnanensis]
MGNFTAALHVKNPPAKAMLSIEGANSGTGTFSNMVSNPDNRAAFIKSTIATARKYGFDGPDIDWEFPSNPDDMSNLSVLFKEWRHAVQSEASGSGKPPLLLSAAVYFASRTYPGHAIAKYLDFVNPMCFDYHGSWDTSVTDEQAQLYDKSSNNISLLAQVMNMEIEGPKRTWDWSTCCWSWAGNNGVLLYKEIVTYNAGHPAHVVSDGDTVSEYSYSGTDWIGYDGPTSVAKKANSVMFYVFGSIKCMGRNTLVAPEVRSRIKYSQFHLELSWSMIHLKAGAL